MSRLLDPKVMMAIKDLSLAAKSTIDGFMNGVNRSVIKGPGLEFSQYRSYQPGDDLRWLDWKMFARSDRYYIRESEVETNIAVNFLVDCSNSMNHTDARLPDGQGGFSKLDYARYLVASLAYLANLQGDAVGLSVLKEKKLHILAPRQSFQHLSRLYYQLERVRASGSFARQSHYRELFSGTRKRELLIFVSDFYEQDGEIMQLLDSLSTLRHEIVVFHLMGRNELELDFAGYSTLEDLETGQTVEIDAARMKKEYRQRLDAHIEGIRMQLLDRHIVYRMLGMDQPLDSALRDFLNQRNRS